MALGTVAADGVTYSVTARAVDEAGNAGISSVQTFIVDNVGPRITATLAVSAGEPARGHHRCCCKAR